MRKILILLVFGLFFTGCSVKEDIIAVYNSEDRSDVLNMKREKTNTLINILDNKKNEKFLSHIRTIVYTEVQLDKNYLNLITKDFFSQYFNNVNISPIEEEKAINVDIELLKLNHFLAERHTKFNLTVKIKVKYKNIIILEKDYTEITDPPIMIESKYLYNIVDTNKIFRIYNQKTLHEGLFLMLEKQFKPDLLEALKKNLWFKINVFLEEIIVVKRSEKIGTVQNSVSNR